MRFTHYARNRGLCPHKQNHQIVWWLFIYFLKTLDKQVNLMSTISPLSVANNIFYLSSNENIPITPMKLQKLLYFLYRDYLIKTNNFLFSNRFEAWKYGSALSIIHDTFGHYKDYNITKYYKSNDRKFYRINEKTNPIFSQTL